jgi:hypothetical protein
MMIPSQPDKALDNMSGESATTLCDAIQQLAKGYAESCRRIPVTTQGDRNHRTMSGNPDFISLLPNVHNLAEERSDDSQQDLVRSDFVLKFFSGEFTIPENLCEKSPSYALATVNWHHRASSVGVTKKVVTSLDPDDFKAKVPKRLDDL